MKSNLRENGARLIPVAPGIGEASFRDGQEIVAGKSTPDCGLVSFTNREEHYHSFIVDFLGPFLT